MNSNSNGSPLALTKAPFLTVQPAAVSRFLAFTRFSRLLPLASVRGGENGDGSAVDSLGRLYVATGASADVFSPSGEFVGSIPGPQGMHGVAFGGKDKKTLFGIVFYGTWGTPSARNEIVALPMLSQGYTGRAK